VETDNVKAGNENMSQREKKDYAHIIIYAHIIVHDQITV